MRYSTPSGLRKQLNVGGYDAFTYSIREKDLIFNYIKNQKRHHHKGNFRTEFERLLFENGIEYDEKYLL